MLLKPAATSACLRSGATGGLFTPTLSVGAVVGALAGHLWMTLWPGPNMASFALLGAVALLAAAIQAPLMGIAMVMELTHSVSATPSDSKRGVSEGLGTEVAMRDDRGGMGVVVEAAPE